MTPHQIFREKIIDPVIKDMGMYSIEASDLLLGTALYESGLIFQHQMNGPAMGLYQMEPATWKDLWINYLTFNPKKEALLIQYSEAGLEPDDQLNLYNPRAATVACRLQFYRDADSIPSDADGQAQYYKRVWNTIDGKGSALEYMNTWRNR